MAKIESLEKWAFNKSLHKTHALIVLHKGNVVLEKYAEDSIAKRKKRIYSLSKMLLSASVGMLLDSRGISLKQNLDAFLNLPKNWNAAIKISDILQMTSGVRYFTSADDNFGLGILLPLNNINGDLFRNSDLENAIQVYPPGKKFDYSLVDQALVLELLAVLNEEKNGVGGALRKTAFLLGLNSTKISETFDTSYQHIFPRLPFDVKESVIRDSLQVWSTPGDLSRAAQVFLDNFHDRKTNLPKNWAKNSWEKSQGHYEQSILNNLTYGSLWWLNKKFSNGKKPLNDLPEDLVVLKGLHGQTVAIFPNAELIVVRFSNDEPQQLINRHELLSRVYACLDNR